MSRTAAAKRSRAPSDLDLLRRSLEAGSAAEHAYVALLGLKERDPIALYQLVSRGLPFEALKRFQKNVDLTFGEVARLIHVQVRTLTRRKAEGRLQADESDRLLRASRLFARAISLFEGDLSAARAWLSARQVGLGQAIPLELARTEVGVRQVEALIGRLEHGIPSE